MSDAEASFRRSFLLNRCNLKYVFLCMAHAYDDRGEANNSAVKCALVRVCDLEVTSQQSR